jgi:hypothetical protein
MIFVLFLNYKFCANHGQWGKSTMSGQKRGWHEREEVRKADHSCITTGVPSSAQS